jgi:outer membrane PBP1 activator LpoA protein
MKVFASRKTALGIFIALLLPMAGAQAQLADMLKQGSSGGSSDSLDSLGGIGGALTGGSATSSSTGNVAGILQFCIKNNYLGGNDASSVKDSLMSKLGGGSSSSDSGYTSGAKGILSGSDGKQVDLSGGGLKAQVTKKVCEKILDQGKSML